MRPHLAIVNARVFTGQRDRPWADALAVSGDRIAAVGSSAEIRKMLPLTARLVDARRALVLPGFIDSHVHFIEGGYRLSWISLRAARNRAEFTQALSEFVDGLRPGSWVLGGDWNHHNWGTELPHRLWIDEVSGPCPVWVSRHDGHMGLANSRALHLAGISADTPNPPGGEIVRDERGIPTGVLKDNAMRLVQAVVPAPSRQQEQDALAAAMAYVARQGVTSVHNMGTWENLAAFRSAHDAGTLTTRIYAAVPLKTWPRLLDLMRSESTGDDWLRVGALKEFVDGSLGSHTALMYEDYDDDPGNCGLLVTGAEELLENIAAADAEGMHCITHAIGDRANALLLDVYAQVAARNIPRDRRFRVEHAQHLRAQDIPRFGKQQVIASVQPSHLVDDGPWLASAIGQDRASRSYAFRSLIDSGAHLALGSDWFVAEPKPLQAILAATTRKMEGGDSFFPGERIGLEDAILGYGPRAAYAEFAEERKGSLTAGRLADIVVLDRDISALPAEEAAEAAINLTVAGGRIVWENPAAGSTG